MVYPIVWQHRMRGFWQVSTALSISLVTVLISAIAPALAQSPPPRPASHLSARVIFRPPGAGTPKKTAGGASRGGCSTDPPTLLNQMQPIVPSDRQGHTLAARPNLFAYVPKTSARSLFFSVKDEATGTTLYQSLLSAPSSSGILRLPLPNTAPELQVGTTYKWSLVLVCGDQLRPDSRLIEGWIQRVTPSTTLTQELAANPSLLQQASLYGREGLWYDMLNALADARFHTPGDTNLTSNWSELLEAVKLGAIATAPLIN